MMRFNVSPTQFISHSSTAWRGITYKRKQRVGWLANTGYDRFLLYARWHHAASTSHQNSAATRHESAYNYRHQSIYIMKSFGRPPWWVLGAEVAPDTSGAFLAVQCLDLLTNSARDWNLLSL